MNDEGIYTSINFMEMYQIFISIGEDVYIFIYVDFGRTLNLCISHIISFSYQQLLHIDPYVHKTCWLRRENSFLESFSAYWPSVINFGYPHIRTETTTIQHIWADKSLRGIKVEEKVNGKAEHVDELPRCVHRKIFIKQFTSIPVMWREIRLVFRVVVQMVVH